MASPSGSAHNAPQTIIETMLWTRRLPTSVLEFSRPNDGPKDRGGAMVEEPNFNNEKELEDAIAAVAQSSIEATGDHAIVLRVVRTRSGSVYKEKWDSDCPPVRGEGFFRAPPSRCGFQVTSAGTVNQIRLLYDADRGEPRSTSELRDIRPSDTLGAW